MVHAGKTCARDHLINSCGACLVRTMYLMVNVHLQRVYSCGAPCVLMVNLTCARDEFAHVVHF